MAEKTLPIIGGCQCGAVRYALYAKPYGTHICHCRMCQKAFGAFYAPLTLIRYKDFAWTRGEPAIFQSSPDVDRGFCSACGSSKRAPRLPPAVDFRVAPTAAVAADLRAGSGLRPVGRVAAVVFCKAAGGRAHKIVGQLHLAGSFVFGLSLRLIPSVLI